MSNHFDLAEMVNASWIKLLGLLDQLFDKGGYA